MHQNRRRKKRPNYGLRTVEVMRGSNGFGFTISGQQPCILSCIVGKSPADQAGLRASDFLISVNGIPVSKMAHDAVAGLISNCSGPIKMTIAENYYSDSSDDELDGGRIVGRKPKYMHKPRPYRRSHKNIAVKPNDKNIAKVRDHSIKPSTSANIYKKQDPGPNVSLNSCNPLPMDAEGPIEYKVLIGYLGTIEMPKQLLPNSHLQTVCSCIKRLRQEKRTPTTVLMTILPTCLTLKNSGNHIIAIYPTNRVVFVGSPTDKESRYFGLVTSAMSENKPVNKDSKTDVDISNSCHVFVIDSKIVDHKIHINKAENFRISCTPDPVTAACLEFPQNALYIVSLIQTIYKLPNETLQLNDQNNPVMANSPQPSASSNSDSGIGYRDDCGNVSDRILVVEFPTHHPQIISNNKSLHASNNRPQGINGNYFPDNIFDLKHSSVQLNNRSPYKNSKPETIAEAKHFNNLSNIRAFDNFRNQFQGSSGLLQKHNNDEHVRLNCRVVLESNEQLPNVKFSNGIKYGDVDSGLTYIECPVDVPFTDLSVKDCIEKDFTDFKRSTDKVSVQSSRSVDLGNLKHIFRVPFESRKAKQQPKLLHSCDNIDFHDKLSPKMYGLRKENLSCEELNKVEFYEEKFCYGSLQNLNSWVESDKSRRSIIAQSEPDVRINWSMCDRTGGRVGCKGEGGDSPTAWSTSFEKLLEDPVGLHAFAEFLKKEFSAENIYFWAACERYRRLSIDSERVLEAQRIFQQHVESGAVEAVNVDAHALQTAEQGLSEAGSGIFDIAQSQIFNLMKFDSYPRFLKSQLYKQCLGGEMPVVGFDPRLSHNNHPHLPLSTPSKLKKSLSNAEDRRRKSLLPWHRKNASNQRSKSKDRNELGVATQKSWDGVLTVSGDEGRRLLSVNDVRDMHSSHSSLTSLDLAATQDVRPDSSESRISLCRVLLSNGSTTVVQIKEDETIQELIGRLLDKRGLRYSSYEVFTNKHPKALNITDPSTTLAGCEVTIEQRVVFKLDLPNRKIISVKSKYTKNIVDVLKPILHKYKFNLEEVVVTRLGEPVDISLPVTTIDNARLNIQLQDTMMCTDHIVPVLNMSNVKIDKLAEITNKVYEGILQEKSKNEALKPSCRSDKGSVKSEDYGSEHSSLLGKFLRKDSGLHGEKKKKISCQRPKLPSESLSGGDNMRDKKPLIAKLKAGANKLHVGACSESDELVEGLTRAQRRLEDQRGTEINFELPDFLKDKEERFLHQTQYAPDISEPDSPPKIALTKTLVPLRNYENQHVIPVPNKIDSPVKLKAASPEKSVLNQSPRSEPPPLPPKPKIVPIKPPNWGQTGFYKAKEMVVEKRADLFFEQSSSSFV